MTNLPGVYMRAPETWPFKTSTIPSKLVPSHKTYAPNNEGLVFVDPCDIATLLGLGFYLYGQTPDINALLAGLPGAGDPSMFLAMDGVGRTPAGGGGSSVLITTPTPDFDVSIVETGDSFQLNINNLTSDVPLGGISFAVSMDGGATFLCDNVNYDTYGLVAIWNDSANAVNSAKGQGYLKWDSVGYITNNVGKYFDAKIGIFPGSDTLSPRIHSLSRCFDDSTDPVAFYNMNILAYLAPDATIAPTYGRITTIRIIPYQANANDPVTDLNFIGGSYSIEAA